MKLKRKRTLRENTELYNYYYRKSGFYKVLVRSLIRLAIAVVIILVAIAFVNEFLIFDFKNLFLSLVESVPAWVVFVMFFISDSLLLSIVPPDLFIVWADSAEFEILFLIILGLISYAAGLFSYYIGKCISKMPKVNDWLNIRFSKLLKSVNKWGGAFIVIAALLPLPWSPALIVTGMMNYPLKKTALFALTRFFRFFMYGFFLFRIITVF